MKQIFENRQQRKVLYRPYKFDSWDSICYLRQPFEPTSVVFMVLNPIPSTSFHSMVAEPYLPHDLLCRNVYGSHVLSAPFRHVTRESATDLASVCSGFRSSLRSWSDVGI